MEEDVAEQRLTRDRLSRQKIQSTDCAESLPLVAGRRTKRSNQTLDTELALYRQ